MYAVDALAKTKENSLIIMKNSLEGKSILNAIEDKVADGGSTYIILVYKTVMNFRKELEVMGYKLSTAYLADADRSLGTRIDWGEPREVQI